MKLEHKRWNVERACKNKKLVLIEASFGCSNSSSVQK